MLVIAGCGAMPPGERTGGEKARESAEDSRGRRLAKPIPRAMQREKERGDGSIFWPFY
ncbi:MAG: hypothetical protein RI897_2507 [Verrucomicrobiota bacterium]|jgi:hypothetical protein